ncbi:MAG: HEPN domain-containing protein [Candidatus Poribacteria bacterium]|nr:HEPN domain-containing protein [Candidatus Poribacteria bacterium]
MTEERKEELRQLLEEAMRTVVIEAPEGYEPISVDTYKKHLMSLRKQYRPDLTSLTRSYYHPKIHNEAIKSKLLEFIIAEFKGFINEEHGNWIQPASYGIGNGGSDAGQPVEMLLRKLLQIAIAGGEQRAIVAFEKSIGETKGSFRRIILLQGLGTHPEDSHKLTEIQICEGVRLIYLPYDPQKLPPYLFDHGFSSLHFQSNPGIFMGKAIIVIDCEVSPLFIKPEFGAPTVHSDGSKSYSAKEDAYPFQISIKSTEFPEFDVDQFCQVISLTCNFDCVTILDWGYIDPDELFSVVGQGIIPTARCVLPNEPVSFNRISETQIPEIKRRYEILTNLDSETREKLQIPIDRWIKSKAEDNPVDKIIDLGIALESLYVPAKVPGKSRKIVHNLKKNASGYLGKNKENREKLKEKFKVIYDCRCDAVHEGRLGDSVTIDGESITMSRFIEKAQNLCLDSIIKILEDGKFPDWNNLILG